MNVGGNMGMGIPSVYVSDPNSAMRAAYKASVRKKKSMGSNRNSWNSGFSASADYLGSGAGFGFGGGGGGLGSMGSGLAGGQGMVQAAVHEEEVVPDGPSIGDGVKVSTTPRTLSLLIPSSASEPHTPG